MLLQAQYADALAQGAPLSHLRKLKAAMDDWFGGGTWEDEDPLEPMQDIPVILTIGPQR